MVRILMRRREFVGAVHSRWVGYAAALVGVALVTYVIGLIGQRSHVGNLSMLHLIVVLAVATMFGSGPAVLAAVAALLTFNWFFVEPFHTLVVADPEEWIALLLFLATALVTGQLAAAQRQRAQEAQQHRRESMVLYDVVRLMSEGALGEALSSVAQRLRQELQVTAVVIEYTEDGTAKRAVAKAQELSLGRTEGEEPGWIMGDPEGRWIRVVAGRDAGTLDRGRDVQLFGVPLKTPEREVGRLLLFAGDRARGFSTTETRMTWGVAAQLASAVERSRLQREATETEILRRTDESKTALLNAVSHDLRTPLATIIASAGSLAQRDVAWTDEEVRELAGGIEQEANRLNRIVGNLLDLSRIEAGTLQPETGWHDLVSLVEDVIGRLRTITSDHDIVLDAPQELPPVLLDYVQIDQVLSNLIENAANYSPAGSEILISIRPTDAYVRVQVDDRGPGIPQEALPRLFEPFYRADGRGPRAKGTGLGLAVAKRLVEAHRGQIWAENRPGGGARFTFLLPRGQSEHTSDIGG